MNEWMTGYPEIPGNYLVTTKSSGTVCMRHFDGFGWAFGEPLAWMWPPIPYKPNNESAQPGGAAHDN